MAIEVIKYNLVILKLKKEIADKINEFLEEEEVTTESVEDLYDYVVLEQLYEQLPFTINEDIVSRRAINNAKIFKLGDKFFAIKKIEQAHDTKITMFRVEKPKYYQELVIEID